MKCGEQFTGSWTGNTYTCNLTHKHEYHRGYDFEGDPMEWPNTKDFCGTRYPGTNHLCPRPPGHIGDCRVKVYGKRVTFKVRAAAR